MSETITERPEVCRRKIPYTSRRESRIALRAMQRKRSRGGQLEVYRCPHCGWFHLGHKRRRRGRQRPADERNWVGE